jgi:beta-carotene hydroxylase
MMIAMHDSRPSLDEIGRDLLTVPRWRLALTLSTPFALTALFFVFAARGWYLAALACPVLLSFLTYGSISHDLVHRNLRIPRWLNESLLAAIELLAFRSGHAYRTVHLHHHARFPADDDLEGAASKMSFVRSLVEGFALQPRLWMFAMRKNGRDRAWMLAEATTVVVGLAVCIAIIPVTPLPFAYAALMIAGSWIFPLITAFIPHDPKGETELQQTKLFRGRMLSILALEHLYHLEHHLYPQVPHHNWRALARRLDPFFERNGVKPIRLLFSILIALLIVNGAAAQDTAPVKPWASSIGAGLAITSGNTDTQNYNFSFSTKYDPKSKVVFKADALLLRGSSNGETQVDRATAAARGEYALSARTFTFAEVSYLRDPFKDIDYLIAPVAGAGYRIIKSDTRNLTVDAAAGVQFESNDALGRTSSGAIKAGEDFDWALSKSSKFTQKFTALWKTNDFGDALYHFDAGLATSVMTRLELKVAYAYDYKNRPPSPTIEKGDSALFAALVFKF